jgi:hypothetical protein
MDAIVGASGFIGKNLSNMVNGFPVTRAYLDSEIGQINVDTLYIAAPSAEKWKINGDPGADLANIETLSRNLAKKFNPKQVLLFSTIDVYENPMESDELSRVREGQSYGGNRARFETLVMHSFRNVSVFRLPGLFGAYLKKNLFFDLSIGNLEQVRGYNPNSSYQYFEISAALKLALSMKSQSSGIMNIVSEPIRVAEILELFDLTPVTLESCSPVVHYDVRSIFSGGGGYHWSSDEVLGATRLFFSQTIRKTP